MDESTSTIGKGRGCCDNTLLYIALLSNGLNIGLNIGILGPSLPDLALQTDSTIPEMSVVFISSSIAYMVGSLACGIMLDRIDGYFVISLTLILQALTTSAAPWCTNLAIMCIFISLSYFFSTVVIAGTAYLCFRLERTKARVMTQSAFLLFNLGKALVPFVVAPFLNQEDSTTPSATFRDGHISQDKSWFKHVQPLNLLDNFTLPVAQKHKFRSSVGYSYAIVAIISLIMSVLYGVIFCKNGCHLWAVPTEKPEQLEATASVIVPRARWKRPVILLLFFLMIFLQCGMESVDAGLLMTFLTEYLHRSKDMGIVANSLYQGTKVIACILVVLTVKYLFPSVLMLVDLMFMLISTSLMAVAIAYKVDDALLWLTFVLLAIGMSNSYATLASWLETQYPISGKITALLTISFGLGSMVLPPITTLFLDAKGPITFPLVLLGSSIACFVIFIVTKFIIGETCCPKTDIKAVNSTEATIVYQEGDAERSPLLGSAETKAGEHSRESTENHRRSKRAKQLSLSELSPDQCFHAYHSKFINDPASPSRRLR